MSQIAGSIKEWGWTTPVLIDEDGGIIAGHGRVLAAQKLGITDVPTMTATGWTEAQKRAYILTDNQIPLNAGWDMELLKVELGDLDVDGFDVDLIGFDPDFLANLLIDGTEGLTDPDDVPETPDDPITVEGDVWIMGSHRLRCGSSSDDGIVAFWDNPDLVLSDPPYCSGGFQEAGRAVGSVGTSTAHKQIANDRLSSRGFASLMKASLFSVPAPFFYIFTDWRMWVYLFDVAESSSAGVRSMITWNKGSPGMGSGWRAQHELIMWACRKSPPYAKGFPGLGNVISLPRQRNELHTTQKPVELVKTLLQGAPFARTVADPFVGSGTTIIACEVEGRSCHAMELDPAYVDVAVKRWQDFTGQDAVHETTKQTFNEMSNDRSTEAA